MQKYHIALTAAGKGRYRAVLTDNSDSSQQVFDDVCRETVRGKPVYVGKETGPISLWTVIVQKRGDFYRIDATDYRFWIIRFDECELDETDGQMCIQGWAEKANFWEEIEGGVAA
ncbi:hypothetical protein [Acetobacter sp.]|uniref:hypothetical protein n=1 Tax=Acetobacter sp. TaxID=440 RepID=UPI0039E780A6